MQHSEQCCGPRTGWERSAGIGLRWVNAAQHNIHRPLPTGVSPRSVRRSLDQREKGAIAPYRFGNPFLVTTVNIFYNVDKSLDVLNWLLHFLAKVPQFCLFCLWEVGVTGLLHEVVVHLAPALPQVIVLCVKNKLVLPPFKLSSPDVQVVELGLALMVPK